MGNAILKKEYIFKDVIVTNFIDLIETMSIPLLRDNRVTEDFPVNVIKREKVFPTGLPTQPYGVAIPHTDSQYVKKNSISIAILKKTLPMKVMGSDDETINVSIVFLLALEQSNKQLNILQQLIKAFKDKNTLEKMMHGTKDTIYNLMLKPIECKNMEEK